MASKICYLARVLIVLSFLLVLANVFWSFKLQTAGPSLQLSHSANIISANSSKTFRVEASVTKHQNLQEVTILSLPEEVVIAAVACDRGDETASMMKSALILSSSLIKFIIFADETSATAINNEIQLWPDHVISRLKLDLRPITFPNEEWKKLFKPCASQRLFLPVGFYFQVMIFIKKITLKMFFFLELVGRD